MSKTYLGIDVHKRLCVFTEIDSKGNVVRRGRFDNNFEAVSEFCRGNVQKARVTVARKLAVVIYVMLKRKEPFKLDAA